MRQIFFEQQSDQQFRFQLQQRQSNQRSEPGVFGFRAQMFPLLGAVIGFVSIWATYYVARNKTPPDVKPFPWTDITHCGIHFPQYAILRVGLMVCAPLFGISFQILKNYLKSKSFQILGKDQPQLNKIAYLSVSSGLLLGISTATISDGGDMNWTLHTIGATGFFILAMYMVVLTSKVYRQIWVKEKNFINKWSYRVKKYDGFIILFLISLQLLQQFKMIEIGSLVEWLATFYLLAFFFTLYFDFKDMEILFMHK